MSKLADTLVAARRQQGWTLEEVEQATRIRLAYLQALEADAFHQLPSPVYTRGFVRNYAAFLGLDPNQMVRLYDDATGYRPEPVRIEPRDTVRISRLIAPNVAAMGIAVVLAGILFAWLYSAFFVNGPASAARLITPSIPTPTPLSTLIVPTPTPTAEPATPVVIASAVAATPTPGPRVTGAAGPAPPAPTSGTPGRQTPVAGRSGTPSPTVDPNSLTLRIRVVEAPSWVQIRTDGVVTFSGTLPAGSERTFTAKQELFIHGGRSDAIDLFLNGVPQGRLGSASQAVVRRTFTRSAITPVATTGPANSP